MNGLTVLHSYPVWLPKTQTWMYSLVNSLPAEIRNEVSCVSQINQDQFPFSPLHSFAVDSPIKHTWNRIASRLRVPSKFHRLTRHLKSSRAEIVHSHFGNIGAEDYRLVRAHGVPHVVTFYGLDIGRLPKSTPSLLPRYKAMFKTVSAVLCEGSQMGIAIEKLGCPAEKIKVQHLGVDLNRFEFRPRKWKPGETLKVLIAAAFREKKGIPFALTALGELAKDNPLAITVIGDAGSDPAAQLEKQKIVAASQQAGLDSVIHWAGFLPHEKMLATAYDHHLFVSTSVTAADGDTEGGAPVSIIEMAATGMPIVSSFHCDIPEVVLDGQTGWLAPERDVAGITACLRRVVDLAPDWDDVLRAGRQHLESNYCLAKQGERLAEIYRGVLSGH